MQVVIKNSAHSVYTVFTAIRKLLPPESLSVLKKKMHTENCRYRVDEEIQTLSQSPMLKILKLQICNNVHMS